MQEESVVFEIQLEKKVLEQVFNENKHLKDSYNQLLEVEKRTHTLKEQIATLKAENQNLQNLNTDLTAENNRLQAELTRHERLERVHEERSKSCDLDSTESKLLKLKLRRAETERTRIAERHETDTRLLDELLRDQLAEARADFASAAEELRTTRARLATVEAEHGRLDRDKLDLELEVRTLTRKLRLEEERNKSNDLAHVECKLLKLKLQTIEHEKNYLVEKFDRERTVLLKQNRPRVAKLEENIKHLRKWIEKEAKERRPRDSEEVRMLKAQVRELENDKVDLIEGFELERKVFRKILKGKAYDLM